MLLVTVRCAGSLFCVTNVVRHFMLALLLHELGYRNEVLWRPGGVIRMPFQKLELVLNFLIFDLVV